MTKEGIIQLLAILAILLSCGFVAGTGYKQSVYEDNAKSKQKECHIHLHNAGKALTVSEAGANLNLGINCLEKIRDICSDNLDDGINILNSLKNEAVAAEKLSKLEQEAVMQKINRVVFEQGTSCYKGKCSFNQTVFICKDIVNYNNRK